MSEYDRLVAQLAEIAARNRLKDILAERAVCAELARSAGCLCHLIPRDPKEERLGVPRKDHDPRCPVALAAAIEARQ